MARVWFASSWSRGGVVGDGLLVLALFLEYLPARQHPLGIFGRKQDRPGEISEGKIVVAFRQVLPALVEPTRRTFRFHQAQDEPFDAGLGRSRQRIGRGVLAHGVASWGVENAPPFEIILTIV